VINFDVPYDEEAYVHRIGRTGRAGRKGKAILFVTPREGRMLQQIERYTGQRITPMKSPTRADVAARRMSLFKERILKSFEDDGMEAYLALVEEIVEESGRDMSEIAAAALRLASSDRPVVVPLEPTAQQLPPTEEGMVRLMIEAGRRNNVHPGDIVGAIANEANVPGKTIGAIDIYDDFTIVEVPAQYSEQILKAMTGATVRGREVRVRIATGRDADPRGTSGAHSKRPMVGARKEFKKRK
jgi:ATP-dependent RNA helicase DeaD